MKVGKFSAVGEMCVEEEPVPLAEADDVVVRVAFCGICGSDLHFFYKGLFFPPVGQTLGHEFSGTVTQVGSNVKDILVGARVTVRPLAVCGECAACQRGEPELCTQALSGGIGLTLPGAFAEYVRVPHARLGQNIYVLPPEVSDEEGALIEPLAVAMHAIRFAPPDVTDTAVVFGAGPIGLCAVAVLKSLGVAQIIVSSTSPRRLDVAKELGADLVLDPTVDDVPARILEITQQRSGGRKVGADLVIDAAGVEQTLNSALLAVRAGGSMVCVAVYEKPLQIDPNLLVLKEVKLFGSNAYADEFQSSIDLIASKKVDLKPLISHQFALQDLSQAFDAQRDTKTAVKVLVKPES